MIDRRTFLHGAVRLTGLGALGARAGSLVAASTGPTVGAASAQSMRLTAAPRAVSFDGASHEAWALNDSLPAPTLRFDRGSRADIELRNELTEPTILHWHGLDVPEAADGHPRLAIGLEMFQRPFQPHLDDYVAGRIGIDELLARTEYFDRWRYDARLYAPIFEFAHYGTTEDLFDLVPCLMERLK